MRAKRLTIIGAGPGGYETAVAAARRGFEVTLVEAGELGGTCLNEGCIPTKALCRTAALLADMARAPELGVAAGAAAVDYPAVAARKDAIVEQLKSGVATLLAAPGIRVVKGRARLAGGTAVEAAGETISADDLIIATGSVAATLPIPGAGLAGVVTSGEMLASTELPRRLCVVGGGVIGLEFASVFRAFGCEVTVLEYAREVLPPFDSDMAKRLRQSLGKRGIAIETQAAVTAIAQTAGGALSVAYTKKGKDFAVEADRVLMAVGRRPNLESLNLADIGVEFTPKGVVTDERMQTSVPHVYAIGDINGRMMLAHAATAQGLAALDAIEGAEPRPAAVIPAAVFTMPEAAAVGMTEDQCREEVSGYVCKKAFFRAVGKAVCAGETDGYCKLLYDGDSGRLLGCHIYGPHAADIVQEVGALMTVGGNIADLRGVVHIHPSLSEIVQSAAHS